ncbi:MAG: hypothetical protein P8Y44_13620 [Acidobacteriota bacterium]
MNRSVWKWLLPLLIALAALAAADQFGRNRIASLVLPTKEAKWIWAPGQEHAHEPISFYAVTSFELSFPVATAELMSLADEESVVFVNGNPVGATRYDDGRPLPVYDVAELLHTGTNRLQVELRSTRGVGAFLLSLEVSGEGHTKRIVSDSSWTIFYDPIPDLFSDDGDLPPGAAPEVWGPPPAGRWSVPSESRQVRTIEQLRAGDSPLEAVRWRSRDSGSTSDWIRMKRLDRFSPGLGRWVTFDFRHPVTGYLAFRFPPDADQDRVPLGLIFVGDEPQNVRNLRPDSYLVGMSGQRVWLDSEPRRFRFVTFVGLVETSGVEVYEVDPEAVAQLIDGSSESDYQAGAFGLPSARLRTPLENEVWSELHGLPSGAGGEQP